MAGVAAAPVYKLLGKTAMGNATTIPPMETMLNGELAFRQHPGGHTDGPNWPAFLSWADRYIK